VNGDIPSVLVGLDRDTLRLLASSLRDGALASGISSHVVRQIVGAGANEVVSNLTSLLNSGWTTSQLAVSIEATASAKDAAPDVAQVLDLVLSGPDLPGIPTSDTAAVVRSLFEQAQTNVLLVGYAVYDGKLLFGPLAERMRANPTLCVRLCFDIGRKQGDTSLPSEIVRRFAAGFRVHHWPWEALPELYYDPRALSADSAEHASLHAKCVVVDRRIALVTSANFTPAAQEKNIEAGVLVRHEPFAARLAAYFDGLIAGGILKRCQISQ
jgi:hypothetical protein